MSRVRAIVQFPHPGAEHVPKDDLMPWNTGGHRRKFMISTGTVLDRDGNKDAAEVVFWGEWESPSHVVHRWPKASGLPTVLHRPCVADPPSGLRQNTDPWVFGDIFLYSNCKQLNARPARSPSALQRLDEGSIILFGSSCAGRFVLDTLFVVGEVAATYTPFDGGLDVEPIFQLCTLGSLAADDTATASLTLFRGATPTKPIDGMFSFVPCRRANENPRRFERPPISLPGIINPTSKQSPSGAKVGRSLPERQEAWSAISDQVRAAGLSLAVHLALPGRC